ncbi:4'-phosphopantetheinyl transferase family protein [Nonomuraea indica]|uniref:4'-phosphopantetheinyl transferase family protein n=1 Tax=Nonomuraea indica TaxID=1581193 RepID=UPI000C7B114B|nr:4'-phosphopantetheinyl transferase superfamily protein [Nonomuraea indica]
MRPPTERPPTECRIWWARPGHARPWHVALLDPAERARRLAVPRPEARDRFTVGCALTRLVLARYLGCPPGHVRLRRTCDRCGQAHGRPVAEDCDLRFSVTHAPDRVAVAFARADAVGLDLERVEPRTRPVRHVLTRGEYATLTGLPEHERARAFLAYWTRKESVVKATGDGLRVPPAHVEVSGPGQPPRLLRFAGRPQIVAGAVMADVPAGPGHLAALTLLGAGVPEVTHEDAADLLA